MGRTAKPSMGLKDGATTDNDKCSRLIHNLELRHQKITSDSDLLNKDEDMRRLRTRILLLKDENTSLRDQVELNNETTTKLNAQCDDLSAEIEAKMEIVRSQEKQLRKQEREYSNLKTELQSMNSLNQDSANVLTEKLALSRELAVLKPEIEHLRSQVNHQQATLADKLALERQVDTLEVELANEKKATKRAIQKRESNDRVEDELRRKLREAEKDLTAEKSERERLEDQLEQQRRTHQLALVEQSTTRESEADLRRKLQDAQRQVRQEQEDRERLEDELDALKRASKKSKKTQTDSPVEEELRARVEELQGLTEEQQRQLAESNKVREVDHATVAEAEARSEQFAKKLEKCRMKLKETQEQLKQAQTDLRKAEQQQLRPSITEDTTMRLNAASKAFRKRKANDIAPDDFTHITIQTPGAEDMTKTRRTFGKKPNEPTQVGEKSAFSITPFLNRGKGISEEDPIPEEGDDVAPDDTFAEQQSTSEHVEAATPEPVTDHPKPVESEPSADISAEDEKPKPQPKPRGRPKKILGEAPSAKKNALTSGSKKTVKPKPSLEKIAENAEPSPQSKGQENVAGPKGKGQLKEKDGDKEGTDKTTTVRFNFAVPQDEGNTSSNSGSGLNGELQKKKKKRKVLGSTKTLFDEEEGEAPPVRKPATAAKRTKAPLGNAKRANAFAGAATFSPLKKDRRGIGASFLA
ncbi:hypothetical protein F5Y15DRAFT_16046 [Xylariaceae sp. FL0016]|nr:hypothetical protein F5Y15DRAFT_16046 [Xylariaceae sp. FL0016]